MVGAIVKRDILAHPVVTVRCFGWRIFWRAILARRDQTFLSLLSQTETLKPAPDGVPEFIQRCVRLETRAGRIYARLAHQYADHERLHGFFTSLSRQEAAHAELLELCQAAAGQERWNAAAAAPWRDVVPRLEGLMDRVEESLGEIIQARDGLKLVIRIESSEINDVFGGVVAASDSRFVQRMAVFHEAEIRHLDFICREIAILDPELAADSQVLMERVQAISRTG